MYQLQVVTPERVVYDAEVIALIAPGEEGYLGVLTNHAPILVALKAGVLIITDKESKKTYYHVSKGFLEVNRNKATIVAESVEPTEAVDLGTRGGI